MRPQEAFIAQPIRSLQTMLQIISLYDERIPRVIPDGIYGQSTLNAVNIFQQIYALPITGIADQKTWEKVVQIFEVAQIEVEKAEPIEIMINRGEVLQENDEGPNVYFAQVMLAHLATQHASIEQPDVNGAYDQLTKKSVASFQQIANLPPTGIIDKQTWKNLVHQFSLNTHHNRRENSENQNL